MAIKCGVFASDCRGYDARHESTALYMDGEPELKSISTHVAHGHNSPVAHVKLYNILARLKFVIRYPLPGAVLGPT